MTDPDTRYWDSKPFHFLWHCAFCLFLIPIPLPLSLFQAEKANKDPKQDPGEALWVLLEALKTKVSV